jgi:NTP pyrophosphatase (non-canonical NTP hydrolase)
MLNELAKSAFDNEVSKGFHRGYDFNDISWQLMKVALIHSEASEVLEALRKSKGEREVVEEIVDILVRTLGFYWALLEDGVVSSDIDEVYREKIEKNTLRPYMHRQKA